MKQLHLPATRAGNWRGIMLEQLELAGQPMWAVTLRTGLGRPNRRHWFHDAGPAIAHAAEQADSLGLPLFDLRDGATY